MIQPSPRGGTLLLWLLCFDSVLAQVTRCCRKFTLWGLAYISYKTSCMDVIWSPSDRRVVVLTPCRRREWHSCRDSCPWRMLEVAITSLVNIVWSGIGPVSSPYVSQRGAVADPSALFKLLLVLLCLHGSRKNFMLSDSLC